MIFGIILSSRLNNLYLKLVAFKRDFSVNICATNGEITTFGKLSEIYHLSPGTIKKRYEKHGDITKCLDPIKPAPKVMYKGKMYNLKELSKIANISYSIFRNLYYGSHKSIEDIMHRKFTLMKDKMIKIDGKNYSGVEISKKYNINRQHLSDAFSSGMTPEEIGELVKSGKLSKKQVIKYNFHGEILSQREISEKYDISYSSLRVYIVKYGFDTAMKKLLALKRQRD